jgi:hypothetical protein
LFNNWINNDFYLTLYTFSFEINESSLSDTRCCITTLVIKEWRDVAQDVPCRTTLTLRHTIGMWDVVMRSVHAINKTWYTVLYHHTMYVMSWSNISIKTNFKQIARVELKCIQYSEWDYILCMTSRYFFRSFSNVRLLCFVSHSNGMT